MTISTAIDASAVARVLGIKTEYKNLNPGSVYYLPQRIALIGQGTTAAQSSYDNLKRQVYTALEVGQTYGFGSPLHLAAMQLLPINGDGIGTIPLTVYPLDDGGGSAAAVGDITPSIGTLVASSYIIRANNINSEALSIVVGDTVPTIIAKGIAAINAVAAMPIIASDGTTKITVTSKWQGLSANDIVLEIIGPLPSVSGVTWALTQPVGGLVNPTVDSALAQIGNVWETMILNCLPIADTVALGAYATFGEGRWGALVNKPLVVFTGCNLSSVALCTAVSDARKTDRTNSVLTAPSSKDLPFVIAARQLARIAVMANNNPPHDYGSLAATGLVPGVDSSQWDFTMRDSAVKLGASTIESEDGVVYLSDIITMYHPTGDVMPAYRYVVDIVKLQNVIFNVDLLLDTAEWDGAPLLPDSQPTTNPTVKKPKMAKAAVAALIDELGLDAIISDPATAKASIQAGINGTNPKRLDLAMTVAVSGNVNVKSVDLFFGFYFGTSEVVS